MSRFGALGLLICLVTGLRLAVLAVTPTDLFFDEAQYWAWGQDFDWGYFSKPPLIAWVIGAVTSLAGSDATFWVRAAAPVLHGITALILGLWIGQIHRPAGLWAAAVYLSMPVLGIGSWMISTDTVMAPFLAGALWAWWRYLERGALRLAVLAGVLAGLAMLGKYAGAYFWLGVAVAALSPSLRPAPRGVAAALAACLVVITPNLVWNVTHGLVTLFHTADNARAGSGIAMNWRGLAEFVLSQAVVIGPVFFVAWLGVLRRTRDRIETYLVATSVPVLLLVTSQAWIAKANANWAFAAYPAAAALVGLALSRAMQTRRFTLGIAVNAVIVLAVTALLIRPDLEPRLGKRYTGRMAAMTSVLDAAGGRPVAADERQILADLTYAAARAEGSPPIYAMSAEDPPRHWYDMVAARPDDVGVVYVTDREPPACAGAPEASVTPESGAYAGRRLSLYPVPPGCR